jgi:hypothetical protein
MLDLKFSSGLGLGLGRAGLGLGLGLVVCGLDYNTAIFPSFIRTTIYHYSACHKNEIAVLQIFIHG